MKKSLITAVALAALAAAAGQASAADYAPPAGPSYMPYISVFAGASFPNDINTTRTGVDYSQHSDTSYVFGGAVGIDWNSMIRTEIELSHSQWNGNSFTNTGLAVAGNANTSSTYLLGNVWLDWKNDSAFTPYVGGGLGVAFVNFDQTVAGGPGYVGSDTVLAYQLGAGINFAVSDQMSLDVGYRYKATSNFGIQAGDAGGDYQNGHLGSHNVQVGLTYKF